MEQSTKQLIVVKAKRWRHFAIPAKRFRSSGQTTEGSRSRFATNTVTPIGASTACRKQRQEFCKEGENFVFKVVIAIVHRKIRLFMETKMVVFKKLKIIAFKFNLTNSLFPKNFKAIKNFSEIGKHNWNKFCRSCCLFATLKPQKDEKNVEKTFKCFSPPQS